MLIFHDLNLPAHFADRVFILKDGKIAALGTPEKVPTCWVLVDMYGLKMTVVKSLCLFHISNVVVVFAVMKILCLTEKLEEVFKARSKPHLLLIFLIFGISGGASIFVSENILDLLNLEKFNMPQVIYWPLRLIVLFVCYQFVLLFVSTCFGEYKHFLKYTQRIFFFLKH